MDSVSTIDDGFVVSARQLRAARALLGWTRQEAAKHCQVGSATLARIELDDRQVERPSFDKVVEGFKYSGIVFFNNERGCGVALTSYVSKQRS